MAEPGGSAMLEMRGVSHVYPDGTRALQDVSLAVGPGLFGLLGPNGAGKSTLMRVVATVQLPSAGSLFFGGTNALREPLAVRRRLGYLPQDFGVYPGVSAYALLDHLAVLKGIGRRGERRATVERLLLLVNLWSARDRAVADFSGGMRQRFGVAQALIGDPALLVVDEPTAGLDPAERDRFHEILLGVGAHAVVLLSTHIVEDVANLCPRLAVLGGGRILATGTPAELTGPLRARVWTGPAADGAAHPALLRTRLSGGRRFLRLLAEEAPGPEFSPAAPELEDAYFAALQGRL